MFVEATREQLKARIALCSPTGGGKSYTALRFAHALITGRRSKSKTGHSIAGIDSEHASLRKYQNLAPDGIPWQFDVCELSHFSPTTYQNVIKEAGRLAYEVLIVDSLSHAWEGLGGALDQIDRSKEKNSFTAWKDVTPQQRAMIEELLASPCHIIVTMRSKMEYMIEKDEKGKARIEKVGLAPVQRQGVEYEFDLVGELDTDHNLRITKSRCPELDGRTFNRPGPDSLAAYRTWLGLGAVPQSRPHDLLSIPGATIHLDAATTMNVKDPCSPDQQAAIKDLAKSLAWPKQALKDVITKRGKQKLADLTWDEAQGIIEKLRAKEGAKTAPF